MQWGTQWNVNFTASRYITNNEFSTVNPRFDTNMTFSVTQPLLKNLGTKVNKRGILVAQNDFSVSREQFRARVQETVFQVTQAYWNLVAAIGSLDVAREGLDLTREQLDRTQTMVRIGVLAQVETLQSEQAVADSELGLLAAEIALENAKDTLKQLLNVRAFVAEGWEVEVAPTEEPAVDAPAIDVDASIDEALAKNPTIRADRINLESRAIDLHAARNQLLPEVNLIGTYALNGLGGDRIFRSGAFGGSVVEIQQGDISDSLQQLLSGEFRDWSVGFQVSLPIGNSLARAQHAQASIRERQAVTQIANSEEMLRLQVRRTARTIQSGIETVRAAQNARDLADRQYRAELRRFEVGTSSNFQVLQLQRLLTVSRSREVQAVNLFNIALANFERVKGTLLESLSVSVASSTDPRP